MNSVGDLLSGAVPDLPAPADRVAEVGARVRRRRRAVSFATVAMLVVGVGAAVGVPQLLNRPPDGPGLAAEPARPGGPLVVGADSCPGEGTDFAPSNVDLPGPLVPVGAVEVALCELAVGGQPADSRPVPPRVLTTGVAEHVGLLNALPGKQRYRELIAERERRSDIDVGGCTLVGFPTEYSLRLRYADRDPVFVLLDRNCGTARVGDITRYWWESDPLGDFFKRYRDQLASSTDRASIKAPACAPTITAGRLKQDSLASGPVDGIGANRYGTDTLLPNDVASAIACRYTVAADGARLARQQAVPADGRSGLRDLVNKQFAKDRNGPKQEMVECGTPSSPLPTRLDSIMVTDATGATTELWFVRAPCTAAVTAGYAGLAPTPEVLALLDATLR